MKCTVSHLPSVVWAHRRKHHRFSTILRHLLKYLCRFATLELPENTAIQSTSSQCGAALQLTLLNVKQKKYSRKNLTNIEFAISFFIHDLRTMTPSRPNLLNVFDQTFEKRANTNRCASTHWPSVVCSSTSKGQPSLYCSAMPLSLLFEAWRFLNLIVTKLLPSMLLWLCTL